MSLVGKRRRWLSVAIVSVLMVAACGDSKDGSPSAGSTTAASAAATVGSAAPQSTVSGGGVGGNLKAVTAVAGNKLVGPAGTGSTRGVTATSVKIGCYFQKSLWDGADIGFKARFERANRTNELPGGRKIEFSSCQDDGNNPQTNLQIVQKLVQQDKVWAVVGLSSAALNASTDFLGNNEVPFYGYAYLPGFCGTRWGFGWNGCVIANYSPDQPQTVYGAYLPLSAIEAAGVSVDAARVAVQGGEDDAGKTTVSGVSDQLKLLGAKVVYSAANIPVPYTSSDYTAFVRAINDAKPNVILQFVDATTAPGLTAAISASEFKGADVNFIGYVPGQLETNAQLAKSYAGAYVGTQIVPQELQTPFVKQMEADLKAVNGPASIVIATNIAYSQADMLIAQLKAVGTDLNTKTFDQVINGGKFTYVPSAAGGPGNLSFPAMHFIPGDCGIVMKVVGTKYEAATAYKCYDSLVVPKSK